MKEKWILGGKQGEKPNLIASIADHLVANGVVVREKGEWLEHEWAEESEGLLISNYECTVCQEWVRNKSNFCPNCGADMRKGENG